VEKHPFIDKQSEKVSLPTVATNRKAKHTGVTCAGRQRQKAAQVTGVSRRAETPRAASNGRRVRTVRGGGYCRVRTVRGGGYCRVRTVRSCGVRRVAEGLPPGRLDALEGRRRVCGRVAVLDTRQEETLHSRSGLGSPRCCARSAGSVDAERRRLPYSRGLVLRCSKRCLVKPVAATAVDSIEFLVDRVRREGGALP